MDSIRYMVKKAPTNGLVSVQQIRCGHLRHKNVHSLREWDLISFKNRAPETSHDNRYEWRQSESEDSVQKKNPYPVAGI